MRYRLRTLLIVLALGPPVLAGGWRWLANGDLLGFVIYTIWLAAAAWFGYRLRVTLAARNI
jgi:hypothetical protein